MILNGFNIVFQKVYDAEKIIAFWLNIIPPFSRQGDECALKPLRLVDIAEQLKMHTSAKAERFPVNFQCEYGTYPFTFSAEML